MVYAEKRYARQICVGATLIASIVTMVTIPPRKNKVPNILGDWDDVRFFLAVAKTGSFSAAATQLNTKQTTVGRRIQALERRLGAKLFDRHRHGMEVTPAARGVLAQAESMMSNATAIERHLAGLDREMAGIVRIAATEGIAAHWLVPRLGVLRRTHPDIIVQVIAGDQVLDLATSWSRRASARSTCRVSPRPLTSSSTGCRKTSRTCAITISSTTRRCTACPP